MKTKVTILGESHDGVTPKKKIEFVKVFSSDCAIRDAVGHAEGYNNVELICLNYNRDGLDLMFAYNSDRNYGILYLGHFNDGVV